MKTRSLKATLILGVGLSLALVITGCKTSQKKAKTDEGALINKVINSEEGWVNDDTYQMVVVGQWDRNRYYIEGVEEGELGKSPKSSLGLEADAKAAAKIKAMRNFKEKMASEITSKTKVENGVLVADEIEGALESVIISPQAVKEEYTKRHDARIYFRFEAEKLRELINKAAEQTLKKSERE